VQREVDPPELGVAPADCVLEQLRHRAERDAVDVVDEPDEEEKRADVPAKVMDLRNDLGDDGDGLSHGGLPPAETLGRSLPAARILQLAVGTAYQLGGGGVLLGRLEAVVVPRAPDAA
jgi:hypothetical protein